MEFSQVLMRTHIARCLILLFLVISFLVSVFFNTFIIILAAIVIVANGKHFIQHLKNGSVLLCSFFFLSLGMYGKWCFCVCVRVIKWYRLHMANAHFRSWHRHKCELVSIAWKGALRAAFCRQVCLRTD